MLPGQHLPVDGTDGHEYLSEGSTPLKPAQEILPGRDPVSRGNTIPADLISTQPVPAAAPPADTVQGSAVVTTLPCDLHKPTCPQCGGAIPDHRPPPGLHRDLARLQGSNLSVHSSSSRSRRRKSRGSVDALHQPNAMVGDSCFQLLLACLSCQCSVFVLGLLETCSSCVHTFCSCCCRACARCCSAIQEAPVEELNCHAHCHSVLFESCCEPTECLEFCLDCCDICHRS